MSNKVSAALDVNPSTLSGAIVGITAEGADRVQVTTQFLLLELE